MGNRSPNQLIPQIMTSSEHGASIFASIKSEDGDDQHIDAEVHNITRFYSPNNDEDRSLESRILTAPNTPVPSPPILPDQLPRHSGQFRFINNLYKSNIHIFEYLPRYIITYLLEIFYGWFPFFFYLKNNFLISRYYSRYLIQIYIIK